MRCSDIRYINGETKRATQRGGCVLAQPTSAGVVQGVLLLPQLTLQVPLAASTGRSAAGGTPGSLPVAAAAGGTGPPGAPVPAAPPPAKPAGVGSGATQGARAGDGRAARAGHRAAATGVGGRMPVLVGCDARFIDAPAPIFCLVAVRDAASRANRRAARHILVAQPRPPCAAPLSFVWSDARERFCAGREAAVDVAVAGPLRQWRDGRGRLVSGQHLAHTF